VLFSRQKIIKKENDMLVEVKKLNKKDVAETFGKEHKNVLRD